jgi:putative transposase
MPAQGVLMLLSFIKLLNRKSKKLQVMLYWAKGTLPGLGTSLVDADLSGATSHTRKKAGSIRQLGEKKRQKSQSNSANNKLEDVETSSLSEAN